MIEAELPDGRVLEFPDGTPTAVVQEAVRKMMGVAPASPSGSQSQVRAVDNAAQPYKPEPTTSQRVGEALVRAAQAGPLLPVVIANEGMKAGNELLEKGAYNVGGAVTDYTGSPAAGYAANVATQAIPAIVGGKVTGMVSAPALKAAGERVMQSAVKPAAADLVSGDAKRAITTLLDEGINVTPGGMAELRKRVGGLHQKVTEAIASSKGTVDVDDVANSIDRAFNKFRWNLANRESNLADIQKAKEVFIKTVDDAMGHYSDKMPVQLAQKIKQATQKYLSDSFGELSTAGKEGLKDITHGLRKGIEKVEPSVAGDNAKMEKLLNALSVTEKHALQALNKNPAGLSLLANNEKAAAAFMADRSALFKSLLARMLYQGRERIPQAVGGAAVGLYEGVSNNQP